ncbi:MAG: hypothetical protein IPN29_09630 [Saprospiraceae bacterium]|nr:hypothetical protein [Saprospiraceae bacterium]
MKVQVENSGGIADNTSVDITAVGILKWVKTLILICNYATRCLLLILLVQLKEDLH